MDDEETVFEWAVIRRTFLADLNLCCMASSKVGFVFPGALHLTGDEEIGRAHV